MTRAEVDQAVERVVHRFREAAEKEQRNQDQSELKEARRDMYERRQSFYDDPRYSYMGIGKRNSEDSLTLRENPVRGSTSLSKPRSHPAPTGSAGGKVFLLYLPRNSRKLTISQLLLPSSTLEVGSKSSIPVVDISDVGNGRSNVTMKRRVDHMGFPGGIGKKRHSTIYKLSTGSKNAHSMGLFELADLLKRNILISTRPTAVKIYLRAFGKRGQNRSFLTASYKLTRPKRHATDNSSKSILKINRFHQYANTEPSNPLHQLISGPTKVALAKLETVQHATQAEQSTNKLSMPKVAETSENLNLLSDSQTSEIKSGSGKNKLDLSPVTSTAPKLSSPSISPTVGSWNLKSSRPTLNLHSKGRLTLSKLSTGTSKPLSVYTRKS